MNDTRLSKRSLRLWERYGPWAVVTGASEGMGREIARELAKAGLNLILVARRARELSALSDELAAAHGVQATALPLDMGKPEDVARLVERTRDVSVGLLVAAAGYGSSGPLARSDLAAELMMVDVNCRAVLALTHHFARRFTERRRGGIVLFGSLVGWQGVPFSANYAATKAYIQSLAEGLRVELAPTGVDVLAVAPGPVASGFAVRADMIMDGATSAATAAADVVAALGRKSTVVPGGLGKFLTYSLRLLPRRLRVRIMGQVMRGMTKHHAASEERQPESA